MDKKLWKNNKKYKKQQLLKALKFSYINRKKKVKIEKPFCIPYRSGQRLNRWYVIHNINWLLRDKYLN